MSTIKVNNVIPPNAGEGVTIDGLQMPTAGPLSNRNLIINGRFRVDQRYNGNAVTMQSGYTVDRFRVHGPTANQFTVDQQTTGVRVTCAAVGAFGHFGTPLEQQDLLPYLGQKMTISFKVRGSTSISQTLDFNDIPTPTSGTAISLDSSTYNVTTSWQTVTRTFTMPSSLSYACVYVSLLQVNSSNMAVNDWVELDEVQLEAGEKNTPFEHRSYSDELQRCQRYYYRHPQAKYRPSIIDGNGGYACVIAHHPVTMRAIPTAGLITHSTFYFNPSGNGNSSMTPNGTGSISYSGDSVTGFACLTGNTNLGGAAVDQCVGQWWAQVEFIAEL
jgi:hypothetical protein